MFKSLFLGLTRYREPAILFVLAIAVFIWGVKELNKINGPVAFMETIRMEITQAEARSISYADLRFNSLKDSIDRIDRNAENTNKILMKWSEEKK